MRPVLPALILFAAAVQLQAQNPVRPVADHDRDAPRASATRLTGSIHIDGVLDEPQWRSAEPLGEMKQLDPQEGRAATERSR
jgi:hypothetical protein